VQIMTAQFTGGKHNKNGAPLMKHLESYFAFRTMTACSNLQYLFFSAL
jgi:hypothetical protein